MKLLTYDWLIDLYGSGSFCFICAAGATNSSWSFFTRIFFYQFIWRQGDGVFGHIICLAYGECRTIIILLVPPKICMLIEIIYFYSAANLCIHVFRKYWEIEWITQNIVCTMFFSMIWIWLQILKLWCGHVNTYTCTVATLIIMILHELVMPKFIIIL